MLPKTGILRLLSLLQTDRPSWHWDEALAELWSGSLERYDDVTLLKAGRLFLEEETGIPNLARIKKRCDAIQRSKADEVVLSRNPSQHHALDAQKPDPDVLLWMKYWPSAVPHGPLRERHEAAWRRAGLEPYYPPLDIAFSCSGDRSQPSRKVSDQGL